MLSSRSLLPTLFLLAASSFAAFGTTVSAAQKDEPANLRWKGNVVRIDISTSLTTQNPNIKIGSDVSGAIRRSLAAWSDVANVQIISQQSDKQSVSPAGVAGDGVSIVSIAATPENVLFFGTDPDALSARTRVFFNRRGYITEADIVLNPFLQFSTDGTYGTFDLESTLRHEIGHLLGLRHSIVIGSAMYDSASKNGVFGGVFRLSPLSEDDISNIRSIYNSNESDDECCGSINGKIVANNRKLQEFSVWVQEKNSGRTVAFAGVDRSRGFKIGGLRSGDYSVFVAETGRNQDVSTQKLGDVNVTSGAAVSMSGRYSRRVINFNLRFLGINGILSDAPIVLQRDSSYTLLAGGRNIDNESIKIGVDSPYISITSDIDANIDYADGISAVSFRVKIEADAPGGDYSIFAVTPDGERDYRIGGITIEAR